MNNFNEYLSSIVNPNLVDKSNMNAGRSPYRFKIIFPDIPELNGVELVVPFSNKDNEWPHCNYADIFRCINAQYPEITSPSFNGDSYRLQIYVENLELSDKETNSKDLTNGATVELRYQPSREPVPGREEFREAGADDADNWNFDEWNEDWDDEHPVAGVPAAAPVPAAAGVPAAAPVPPAPADPFPPILHPRSRTFMTYDHKSHQYFEPILNGTSGKWMIYDPAVQRYSEPLAPWSGGPPTPGTAMQGPPPMVYPNSGQQTGPFKYGGKKPKSKRGKKKSKSKSKTKKSKSKSKRNKRRSYKRVN